jgi:hypothetical protein
VAQHGVGQQQKSLLAGEHEVPFEAQPAGQVDPQFQVVDVAVGQAAGFSPGRDRGDRPAAPPHLEGPLACQERLAAQYEFETD